MNTYEYQKLRGLKRKLHLIDLRGSCCEKCGYNKNLASFDFHHKDPTEKESELDMRTLSNSTMKWILEEFEKCTVLCANCHREVHNPDLDVTMARSLIKTLNENITLAKVNMGPPKCKDCGCEINYSHERCRSCTSKLRRKVKRPDLIILKEELQTNGVTWCANKYKVSRKTINRWIERQIQ